MPTNINIDFQIYDSRDPNVLIVLDTSNWMHILDKPSIIEITAPGDKNKFTQYFDKKAVNIFTGSDIGLNCFDCGNSEVELPDGIYDITVKGSPDKFFKNRKYLRTTKIQLELDKLFIKSFENYSEGNDKIKKEIKKLNEMNLLLRASEANVRYGNNKKANELFTEVRNLIKKTNCDHEYTKHH